MAAVEGSGRAAIGVNRGGDNAQSDGSATGPAAASATPVPARPGCQWSPRARAKLTVAACRTSADEASLSFLAFAHMSLAAGDHETSPYFFRTSRVGVEPTECVCGRTASLQHPCHQFMGDESGPRAYLPLEAARRRFRR